MEPSSQQPGAEHARRAQNVRGARGACRKAWPEHRRPNAAAQQLQGCGKRHPIQTAAAAQTASPFRAGAASLLWCAPLVACCGKNTTSVQPAAGRAQAGAAAHLDWPRAVVVLGALVARARGEASHLPQGRRRQDGPEHFLFLLCFATRGTVWGRTGRWSWWCVASRQRCRGGWAAVLDADDKGTPHSAGARTPRLHAKEKEAHKAQARRRPSLEPPQPPAGALGLCMHGGGVVAPAHAALGACHEDWAAPHGPRPCTLGPTIRQATLGPPHARAHDTQGAMLASQAPLAISAEQHRGGGLDACP